jgi:hypothetical protein
MICRAGLVLKEEVRVHAAAGFFVLGNEYFIKQKNDLIKIKSIHKNIYNHNNYLYLTLNAFALR